MVFSRTQPVREKSLQNKQNFVVGSKFSNYIGEEVKYWVGDVKVFLGGYKYISL